MSSSKPTLFPLRKCSPSVLKALATCANSQPKWSYDGVAARLETQGAPEGRNRALVLLAITLVLSMSTWFSASAVVPQLRIEWNLNDTTAAWMTIVVQLGFVAGALFSAVFNVADLISPRHVIFGGSVGAAVANGFIAVADGPATGIPLRLATGFFLAGVYPPAFKLISTWFRKGRGTALGILVGALVTGNGLPHLVNGLGGLDWQVVIYATSALTLMGGLITEFAVREGPYPFPKATFDPRQAGQVFRNPGVRLASFGYFGHMWELYAAYAWFLVFFTAHLETRGLSTGTRAAFVTFGFFLISGVGCLFGGILGDRWGRTKTTALAMTISASCTLIIGLLFDAPTWLVIVVAMIWALTIVADSAQFSTMVTELASQAYVGTALTLQLAIGFTVTVATIWLIPMVEETLGWRWTFAILAPGPILGVIAMLRLRASPSRSKIAGGLG